MIVTLLNHQISAFWRSKNTGKSIAIRIFMAILIIYILLNVLVLAFFMDTILKNTFPNQDVIKTFNSFILYYFLLDLLWRFQLQELPTLAVKPYLHLNLKKNQLINYLSFTSLGSTFNITPLLLSTPFLVKVLLPEHGYLTFGAYILSIGGLTLCNNFFSLWIKRKVNLNANWMVIFLGIILLFVTLDFQFQLFSISALSGQIFGQLVNIPFLSLIFLISGALIYIMNFKYLKSNLYLEELSKVNISNKSSTEIPFLGKFGIAGDLVANELKLILRNKRPKSAIMTSMLLMFYGLILYNNPYLKDSTILFCGMFMTGIFIINYGQFMFSWQGAHFDGILVSKINIKEFFKAKFLLFTIFSCITFTLSIPYVYFGRRVLLIHFVMLLWNLGVNTVLVLYFANQNHKRIDLSKGSTFNWEGVGASQWLLTIPLLLTPFILYFPFYYFGYSDTGIVIIGAFGLISMLSREFWLNMLIKEFNKKRFIIAEGFRIR